MPIIDNDQDLGKAVARLWQLRGGVIDTSTLIYAERLQLVPLLARQFRLVLIPQVVAEFGHRPEGLELLASATTGAADEVLIRTAVDLHLPLLSEDGRLLRQARRMDHPHYNTLMLMLALLAQGRLSQAEYAGLHTGLLRVARYSAAVVAYGENLHRAIISNTGSQIASTATAASFAAH